METLREKLRRLRRENAGSQEATGATGAEVVDPLRLDSVRVDAPYADAHGSSGASLARDGDGSCSADGELARDARHRTIPAAPPRDALAHEPALDAEALAARQRLRATLARRDARRPRTLVDGSARSAAMSADPTSADELAAARATPLWTKTDVGEPRDLVPSGGSVARIETFERGHGHGDWRLTEIEHALPATLSLCARDTSLAGLDLRDALYLDTETTGLSGGAGMYVYLVGLGSFRDDHFELWQGFLPDPSHERALLEETAERIERAPLVVTFFGKAFDRHRLEDKMRMHGVRSPFEKKPHLDLYHPLRRLYGGAFQDTRLRTFEDVLCGVQRAEDLPGAFAPAAWFDYLAGRAHRLEGVFAHNKDDVLSLVTLAAHLGRVVEGARADGRALKGAARACELALARLHDDRRDFDRALAHLERACAASQASEDLELARATLLMRAKRHAEAHALLTTLAATTASVLSPRVFLSLARAACAVREPADRIAAHLDHAERELDQRWTGRAYAQGAKELATLRARAERAARPRKRGSAG